MMKCPACGAEIKDTLATCGVCGVALSSRFPGKKQTTLSRAGRQGGRAAVAVLVIILVAAAAGGGWYYFYLRSPQYAAKQFLTALQAQDYDKLYESCVWTGFLGFVNSGEDVRRTFDMAKRFGVDISIEGYQIEQTTVKGDSATVKTTVRRTGKEDTWNVIVVKTADGRWKCDLLSSVMSAVGGSLRMPIAPSLQQGN